MSTSITTLLMHIFMCSLGRHNIVGAILDDAGHAGFAIATVRTLVIILAAGKHSRQTPNSILLGIHIACTQHLT